MDDFIGNIYKQNCGDSLLVVEESYLKKGNSKLYERKIYKII